MEHGTAAHLDRRPRVMGEHEDRAMVRRAAAPPTTPRFVRPGAANGAEHVPAHDPGADVAGPTGREVVVNARQSPVVTMHLLERLRSNEPAVQCQPADAEGVVETLLRSSSEAI